MSVRLSCPLGRVVNQVVEPLARLGVASQLPIGPALVAVETVGRRTRRVRTVPLLALRAGNRVIVGTVRSRSQWFANVDATRVARVWLGGQRRESDLDVQDGPLVRTVTMDVSEAD
jgi:F420H(2)-dependent quinone reductase